MASITKKFFNETIKEIYQQTGAVSSLEDRRDHQLLMNSLKNFEAQQVFNWQFILYPLLNGPKESEYQQYAGMRSKPWAEFDSLDPIFGGIHGWTLTAEPWATEDSIPALWDSTNKQPHSITGALYYLSEKVQALIRTTEEAAPQVNTSDLADSLICIEKNIETIYKDVYGCGFTLDCDGERQNQFSIMTHLYHIFDQIIDGGPTIYVDSFCEETYPTLSLYLPVSGLTYDTTINQQYITGLPTDLRAIRSFIGMDQPNSVPDYSYYNRGSANLHYISDGDSLELSIYNLDQAINSVANSTSLQTLDQSYYQGISSGSNFPGKIYLRPEQERFAGVLLTHYSSTVDENGVIDNTAASIPLGNAAFSVIDLLPNYLPNLTNHSDQQFEVGQHEVGRNFTLGYGVASATSASKFGGWFFDNVHFYKSVINNQPTSGIPNTRSKNDTAPYSYGGILFGTVMDETAIWVADGNNELGNSWLTVPPNARPLDCDGNLVEADNLYFRQPDNGTIYKLNKCGTTIQTTSYNGGTSFTWGEDAPLGAVPAQMTVDSQFNHYEPSSVMFVNLDGFGVTVGWNGTLDTSDESATFDTLLVQEHQAADLNKVSLRLRSTVAGSKNEINFSDKSAESEVDLATIVTGSASDFEFITYDDNKDIVFKPYNSENLRLYTNGLAKFSGNLWVAGSLLVDGETTYINSTTLQVDDKNIELGTVNTPTDITADGGGITLKASSDKTIKWSSSDNTWNSNVGFRSEGGFYLAANTSILLDSSEGFNYLASSSKPFDESHVIDSYVESLKFGNAAGDEGKIRYASNDFEGHNGTSWVSLTSGGSGGGIALTDLSVSTATAFGSGSLSYNNTNGTFTFTPPDLSGLGGSDNLGNHTATQDLNLSNFEIDNAYKLNMVSVSSQHPEINSPAALSFNSQKSNNTNVCDYNFGGRPAGNGLQTAAASINLGSGGGGFVNIQPTNGTATQQVWHLPSTVAAVGQILKVSSINAGGQTYLEWSNECCDTVAPAIETINTTTGDPVGDGGLSWNGDSNTLTYNPPDLSGTAKLSDFSVTTGDATPGSAGSLSYFEGVFTFTPPDITSGNSFSGNYADLTGTPTIPTSTSQLTNDSGFVTTDTNTWRTVTVAGNTLSTTESLNISAGSGIVLTEDAGNVTISNSNPDKIVTLTGSGATSVTGTYPNFTISSTDTNTQLSTEQVQDIVGGMVSSNSETGISVTYDDASGKLNFNVTASGSGVTRLSKHVDYARGDNHIIDPHNIISIYAYFSGTTPPGSVSFDRTSTVNGGWQNGDTFKIVNLSNEQTLTFIANPMIIVGSGGPAAASITQTTLSPGKSVEGYWENNVFYVFEM